MIAKQIQNGESKKLELKEESNYVSIVFYWKTSEFNNLRKKSYQVIRAREILFNLVKKGILEKTGKTKGSYYTLKEKK